MKILSFQVLVVHRDIFSSSIRPQRMYSHFPRHISITPTAICNLKGSELASTRSSKNVSHICASCLCSPPHFPTVRAFSFLAFAAGFRCLRPWEDQLYIHSKKFFTEINPVNTIRWYPRHRTTHSRGVQPARLQKYCLYEGQGARY